MIWPPAPTAPTLGRGDVHLYRISLATEAPWMPALLSEDERERAARFRFEEDRRAFSVGRAHMRRLLSAYVGIAPEALSFTYGDRQKPRLDGQPVRFNLSNSGELALLAVSLHEVGVDLERTERTVDQPSLADRFFSTSEAALYRARAEQHRNALFFTLWTRKEAYLKALGEGLHVPLNEFVVMEEGSDAPLLRAWGAALRGGPWQLCDVAVDEGYAAALAVELDHPPRVLRYSA